MFVNDIRIIMSTNITTEQQDVVEETDHGNVWAVYRGVIGTLIVLINGAVLVCLRWVKHSIPEIYTLQITIIGLVDLMSGVSVALSVLLTETVYHIGRVLCSATLVLFMSTQATTLYMVMAIGINRVFISIRMDKMHYLTKRRVVLYSGLAVFLSILLCSLPYVLFLPSQDNIDVITECSLVTIFGENHNSANMFYRFVFVIPLVATNILYGFLFVILKCIRGRNRSKTPPDADNAKNSVSSSGKMPISEPKPHPCLNKTNHQFGSDATHGLQPRMTRLAMDQSQGSVTPRLAYSSLIYIVPIQDGNRQTDHSALQGSSTIIDLPHAAQAVTPRRIEPGARLRTATSHETRAFTLIGLVLLFLNVFAWPPLFVLYLLQDLSTETKTAIFTTVSFNSLVNPILYTIQLPKFRKSLAAIFSGVINR